MSNDQYMMLDGLIVCAISCGKSPLYFAPVTSEAKRIADATGREDFRVTDGRLQALRKLGIIKADRKSPAGWVMA